MPQLHLRAMTVGFALLVGLSSGALADSEAPYSGPVVAKTKHSYITEDAEGTATLTYRKPSSTFAPYESAKLNEIAGELDVIFANIAQRSRGD